MPRSGFGAGVVVAFIAAAALTSCTTVSKRPVELPQEALTPVDTVPTTTAVIEASKASTAATELLKAQAKELEKAHGALLNANDMAEQAYVEGLLAGSDQAAALREVMFDLTISVEELTGQNEAITTKLKISNGALNDAIHSIQKLERDIGKVEEALYVARETSRINREAFDGAANANLQAIRDLAVSESWKKRWRVLALTEGAVLLTIILTVGVMIYRKVSFPI